MKVCFLFLLLAVQLLRLGGASSSNSDGIGISFAYFAAYHTKYVTDYIQRTKPWKEGKRVILDYGCGGGSLSRALAELGATRIVAFDISPHARRVASAQLKHFAKATVNQPRSDLESGSIPNGPFSPKYDIIVSYRGALSHGTTKLRRLEPANALMRASGACRKGGSVIIAASIKNGSIMRAVEIAAIAAAAIFVALAPAGVGKLPTWKLIAIALFIKMTCLSLDFGFILVILLGALSKEFQRNSILVSTMKIYAFWYYIARAITSWKQDSLYKEHMVQKMQLAGLSDIKTTLVLGLKTYQPIIRRYHKKVHLKNFIVYPQALIICEGTKTGRCNPLGMLGVLSAEQNKQK